MDKKKSLKAEDMKKEENVVKRMNASSNLKPKGEKSLPWWVELLFVQIGLPDKFLIKILKSKKKVREFIKNDKKYIFSFLLFFGFLGYFYPVVRYSMSKLNCESNAKVYLMQAKKNIKVNRKYLKMLSTNFCNGGNEVQNFEN